MSWYGLWRMIEESNSWCWHGNPGADMVIVPWGIHLKIFIWTNDFTINWDWQTLRLHFRDYSSF